MNIFIFTNNIIIYYYWYTGYGGGYNERDGVEYVEREASDDEFDEVVEISCM